jgi:hypothetical protein
VRRIAIVCLLWAAPVAAQEELPAGHPPVQGGSPHAGGGNMNAVLGPPAAAVAQPSADVPVGTIRVLVVDPRDRPVAESNVELGVMGSGGDRTRRSARTGANGITHFRDLATGSAQAYRVNVRYRGATYSSTPFQLPTDRGYTVRVARLPVTRDDQMVFFNLYRVIVELAEERMHVITQAELTNAGQETFVLPQRGLRVRMPPGALAFQSQQVMTDQRVEEVHGSNQFSIKGSLPPGTVQLAWAYDVPIDGADLDIPVAIPLRFFTLQVFAEAAEDLEMRVDGLPFPERLDNEGRSYWATHVRRRPNDPMMTSVTVELTDIPGPGPLRWIAMVLALLFVAAGVGLALSRREDREGMKLARKKRRESLLAEARMIEDEHAAGEIGPEFRQKRREEIVRELAVLLHEDEAAKAPAPAR